MKNIEDVSLVMLSHNRREEIEHNIPNIITEIKGSNIELIVVDSASTDGSQKFLSQLEQDHECLTVILTEDDLGVAEGRNMGCREATGEYLVIIDDDTRITEENIRKLVYTAKNNPKIGIVTPKIQHFETGEVQTHHRNKSQDVGNFHGACHLIKRRVWDSVGELDPKCEFGGEELDYSIRTRAAGYKILYEPDIVVQHNNFPREGTESEWRRKMWVYNYLRIHAKHFPLWVAILFSFRYLFTQCFSAVSTNKPTLAIVCVWYGLQGFIEGRQNHSVIPKETVRCYQNPDVRPDIGNVPLSHKLRKRMAIQSA